MGKSLYVFNPENDLALADGSWNYTAPKYAKKIRSDLQMLPLWFAQNNAVIFADRNKTNCDFLNNLKRNFDSVKDIDIFDAADFIDKIYPWGWSPSISYQMQQLIDNAPVPSEEAISGFRQVSHRKTSIDILKRLGYNGILPKECFNIREVEDFIKENGDCIVKAPWSSSGKGVFLVSESTLDSYRPLIGGFIKKQGSIICEKFLDKVLDFAMEYKAENGNITFVGLSVFENNNRFSYDKAVVGTYEVLLDKIIKYVPEEEVLQLIAKTEKELSNIIPENFSGYLGLDMMVYRQGETNCIMPCIELNLRTTMGFVASVIGESIIGTGKEGQMAILYHGNHNALMDYTKELENPIIENGHLVKGSLHLVPIYTDSLFTAVVTII